MVHRYILGSLIFVKVVFSQLTPAAATIIDAYMPYGGDRMNSFALYPVIPNIGYTPEAPSVSFHLSTDVDLYSPGIAALTATGMEYDMFFQWADLETTPAADIVADDPDIDDPLFGVQIRLDGTPYQFAPDKYYHSMNRAAWRNFFLKCVKRGITAGAQGVVLDGAASLHLDSFDPEDVSAFLDYMLMRYDTTTLNNAGWDFQTMDYRTWIYDNQGYTDFPLSLDIQGDAPPFAREWLDFKLERNQQTWEIIQDSINTFGAEAGRVITVYGNNAYLGQWNEASIYNLLNQAGRNLPYYKGELVSEYFYFGDRYPLTGSSTGLMKNAQALGVRGVMWSSPNPEGTDQLAYEQQKHLVAESFASGGIAEFGGPGTADLYSPFFYMIQTQRALLNSVQPHGQAAVLLPTTSGIRETFLPRQFGAQMLLQELGVTYNVVAAGNNIDWPDEFTLDQISAYPLVVLPEAPYLTQNQVSVLLSYISNGGNLLTFGSNEYPGYSGGLDENNEALSNPDWEALVQNSTGLRTYGAGHVYLLESQPGAVGTNMDYYWNQRNSLDPGEVAVADNIRNAIAAALPDLGIVPDIRRENMDRKIMVFRHDTPSEDAMLIHFVNGNVDANTLLHSTQENLTASLTLPTAVSGDSVTVTFYNPDHPDGYARVNLPVVGDSIEVTVPSLFIWTLAYVQEQVNPPVLAVGNIVISNAQNGNRLKSDQIPEFTWDVAAGSQASFQLQLWNNALYEGTPLFDTGEITSSSTIFQPLNWQPAEGQSYMVRVRIRDAAGNASAWSATGFHNNLPPIPPAQPWIYDSLIDAFYYGIFDGSIEDTFPIFKFQPGGDAENDSLRYLVEIWTDSLRDNVSDSTNLFFVHNQLSDEIYPVIGFGDFVFDTLTSELDIDNYGMWWRARSFDGLDTSAATNWGRFTWDHRNDPPNPFDLTAPEDGMNTGLNVTFQWNFEGDSDPSSHWLAGADLYLAEDENFTVNPEILENAGLEVNQNPHIDYPGNLPNHKHLYWKVLVHDQNDGSQFSNQVWSIFTDDGNNGAPGYPVLITGAGISSLSGALEWNSSTDPEADPVYYELQISAESDFSDTLISRAGITTEPNRTNHRSNAELKKIHPKEPVKIEKKGRPARKKSLPALAINSRLTTLRNVAAPIITENREVVFYPLVNLGTDTTLLEHGVPYYWRVRAYDRFGGDSGFSGEVGEFTLNGIPVTETSEVLTLNEDESGIVIQDLNTIFTDPDGDDLTFTVDDISAGIDSARVVMNPDSAGLMVFLTENAFGDSFSVAVSATDPFGGTVSQLFYLNILPVNDAPEGFDLLAPGADSVIVFTNANLDDSLAFSWAPAVDVDGDSLTYALTLTAGDTVLIDTVVLENSLSLTYGDLNTRLTAYAVSQLHGQWTVAASDSSLDTEADNGPLAITLRSEVTTAVAPEIPLEFALQQNYPNPFNPVTTIEYALPRDAIVTLTIYDIRGQVVKTLVNQPQLAGYKSVRWSGTNAGGQSVSSGIYIYRIMAGSFTDTKKLMLLK